MILSNDQFLIIKHAETVLYWQIFFEKLFHLFFLMINLTIFTKEKAQRSLINLKL